MGRKQLHFCDLCKQEAEKFYMITIRKPDKRSGGNKYELCPDCASKLQTQLVSDDRELPDDWEFQAGPPDLSGVFAPGPDETNDVPHQTPSERRAALQEDVDDAEIHALEQRKARKRAEAERLREEEEEFDEEQFEGEGFEVSESQIVGPQTVKPEGDECPHMNRTRVRLTMRNKQRYAYRTCKDCGAELPEAKLAEREGLKNVQAPAGTRVEAHAGTRKRNES